MVEGRRPIGVTNRPPWIADVVSRVVRHAAILTLLLWPVNASAQASADHIFNVARPLYVGLAAMDAYDTYRCVQAKTCHEANPVLAPLVDRRGITSAMVTKFAWNVGIVAGLSVAHAKLPNRKKELALAMVGMVIVQGYVNFRNDRELRK